MNRAFLYIIIGAALWGTIGWYVNNLYTFGFTPMEVVTLRAWSSAILLVVYLIIVSPKKLKLHTPKDIKYFLGTGILSIIFFNYCLFTAIELSTIPVATALLYTAPAFVTIMSFFLFKEPLTRMKMLALVITLFGTCLVVGLIPLNLQALQISSILFGLGSGIGYALYSIFSKFALKKYTSLSITTYTFIIAAGTLIPFFPYEEKAHLLADPTVLFYAFGLGFLPTAFAYIIYTYGLQQTEASKASILTTIEPVVATFIGVFIFHEAFTMIQMVGMAFIIGAVILIQLSGKQKRTAFTKKSGAT
ncbi:drug/metabolite transporter (DMT)-like permease [Virgibacillus natechei]|uniref:Drug/metabolite transporter (DMT)-like permease n=1 Tax=Virgibacillus natechei TaxID=1216297 RepID=A0ABS4IBF9_9BACI|nr:EamA family transporter [Virgibacillus natechei]MBP1968268.1 drug/metabolite transporter (DMT)-like permease [Virgibacillus natechei]UZD14466.1 DMT family transporter [Virgibacillus natechei]